jgi:hypothetical protein
VLRKHLLQAVPGALALCLLTVSPSIASASSINIGYVSWDVVFPGNAGQFDITNLTGANSVALGDPSFPVVTPVNLGSLSLTVHFDNATTQVFGPATFTLSGDGLSFNGSAIPIGGANPHPTDATLTGTFSPLSLTLDDASTVNIEAAFTATISPSVGTLLSDGDLAIIQATTTSGGGGGGGNPVPEPGTMALIGSGVAGLLSRRRHQLRALLASKRRLVTGALVLAIGLIVPASSWAANLSTWTTPDNGVAGVNSVNITAGLIPAGTITPANVVVSFATSCGGAPVATAKANSVVTIIGSTKRFNVTIPAALATGLYFVTISDAAAGDANFTSANCSKVNVTHTNATLAACVPTSSLGLLATGSGATGKAVAYVPNGWWGSSTTGIRVVPIEGPGAPTGIVTPVAVNSCAANPATGQVVCTANTTNVFLISGSTLTNTLNSSSDGFASFSGGSCKNCGVAINSLSNQAVIAMGKLGSPSGDAVQFLDLNTNTFGAPFNTSHDVSEDISIDPTRGLVLSPNENSFYDILRVSGSTVTEFTHATPGAFHDWDSAAEDCTTGIALSVGEFTSDVYLTDLTQATFNTTTHTWTGPEVITNLTGTSFAAGASAISVAPGTSHQAIVTGEFGGNAFAILQLPATSGSGTPAIVDWAYVASVPQIPNPAGGFFPIPSAGFDPHTVTAYTSTVDGKAYAVSASWNTGAPTYLVIYDMAAILAAPRNPGTHTVTAAGVNALVASGAIRGVSVF